MSSGLVLAAFKGLTQATCQALVIPVCFVGVYVNKVNVVVTVKINAAVDSWF